MLISHFESLPDMIPFASSFTVKLQKKKIFKTTTTTEKTRRKKETKDKTKHASLFLSVQRPLDILIITFVCTCSKLPIDYHILYLSVVYSQVPGASDGNGKGNAP